MLTNGTDQPDRQIAPAFPLIKKIGAAPGTRRLENLMSRSGDNWKGFLPASYSATSSFKANNKNERPVT
ncbi:MAG: hypothetical protein JWO78_1664 [Micavibrio sp.]|nr:hypothetical protein [Micavibrio sp.]